MFPKGTVTAAVTPAEKPPVTAQKESTVVYMVDNADSKVDAVNDPYWRTQRVKICACSVVLTTLILVAGTLAAITIVLTQRNGVETSDPHQSLSHDREPLLSNEVPLPKLPESTIRIKIDDGGLLPPREPTTPDLVAIDDVTNDITKPLPTVTLPTIRIKIDEPATPDIIAVDDVTDDITEPLPAISLSSSGGDDSSSSSDRNYYGPNYISSSFPYDGYYMRGQEGIPPWDQSNWVGPSERARDETDLEVSGDDQEKDYESGEPDLEMTEEPAAPSSSISFVESTSFRSEGYFQLSEASDGIVPSSSDSYYRFSSSSE